MSVWGRVRVLDIDMQPLNERVYNLLVRAMLLGWGFFNVVYELEMRTGPPLVARIQWNFKADVISSSWAVEKISREVAVLKLLHRVSPQVPAPRVLACNSTILLITFVKSLTTSFVGIFNVRLPSIGYIETLTPGGLPIIGSILPIRTLAISAIPRDDHTMFVPVLVHMDLRSKNTMVKDATVSGIVDWELQHIRNSYVTMPLTTLNTEYNLVQCQLKSVGHWRITLLP
ncbi:hypothetical protein BU17DRAFT_65313 [Hysterangium stoloniferum]|nr:hypothetical protein BU17DRAFT_65313 [Hysterangium stoloniferum]